MSIKIRSFGATTSVTGSCHLLEFESLRILIDCGMFQGLEEEKNFLPFEFDPSSIDFLVLTHSHIDHIGRVPKLVKQGFRGKIISTVPTKHLSRIMLLDSAKVMAEEYKIQYKKALRKGRPEDVKVPIYDEDDVKNSLKYFSITLDYNKSFNISNNIKLTFFDAGHILGSAFVKFEIRDKNETKSIVFSGDLGLKNRLIINPITPLNNADYVFIESTYGNRKHKSLDESIEEFKDAILTSFEKGGNIVIPTFALERSQEILYILRKMYYENQIPEHIKVFLDSPLAINATKIFLNFPQYFNKEAALLIKKGINPFTFPNLYFTETSQASREINDIKSGAVILAGSGMCTGGRIKHHLKHNLWREESSIVFVGYQAKGTLGRRIIDGEKYVKIYGEDIAVKAKIFTINGFSSHGDYPVLIDWLKSAKNSLRNVFIIHGEEEVKEEFKEKIQKELNIKTHIVQYGEEIYI